MKQLTLNRLKNKPEIFREALEDELIKRGISNSLDNTQKQQLLLFMESLLPDFINNHSDNDNKEMLKCLSLVGENMHESSRTGHLKGLKEDTYPIKHINNISHLNWTLQIFPSHSLILGDVAIWAIKSGCNTALSLVWAENKIDYVFFPISHSHALIGSIKENCQPASPDKLNNISASLSIDFFFIKKKC